MEPGKGVKRRRRSTRIVVIAATLVTLAVAGVATVGFGGRHAEPATRRSAPAGTDQVTRQTLTKTVTVAGDLGYGTPTPLAVTAAGTVTWLPEVGAVIRRGGPLLRVDDQPVLLLYGSLPMYRDLTQGLKGTDVQQFKRNLAALGYRGVTVDEEFSAGTTSAVKHWQRDLKLPETGVVERGRVSYTPGSIRVAQRTVRLGATAAGDVLSYTGTTKTVTVTAAAAETSWAVRGAKVTIRLPTDKSVDGTVTAVGAVGTATGAAPGGEGQAATDRPGTDRANISVTIAVADQRALGGLSGAPVDVRYVAQERKDVLTVPVDALLALAEGGYGVELTGPAGTKIVPVEPGMFADGRVEVTGADLADGTTVGVPR